jgi:cell wall-associated NlpC family hydrolase
MSKKIYTKGIAVAMTIFILTGMIWVQTPKEVNASYKRYVTASSLIIRAKASSSSKKVGSYAKGTKVTCYGTSGNWTKVKKNGTYRYVYTKYLAKSSSTSSSSSTRGQDIVDYALKFVGNPYKYGGTSLTKGADCSGFTQSVYKHFGYSLPRTSSEQRSAGTKVSWSKKQPGDLICYYGHVAIYIGNNKVVHASSAKTGIKITSPADYRKVASVRRIVN